MKKLLFLLFACSGIMLLSQNPIPNGDFENWNDINYLDPQGYESSNRWAISNGLAPNAERVTDAYSGSYAVRVTNVATAYDTLDGYFANGDPENPAGQGIPYAETPIGLRGYYKSSIQPGDTAAILVIFKQGGNVIGEYVYRFSNSTSVYTLFDFTFSPALASAPDSIIFGATSGNGLFGTPYPGSMIQLDSVSFTGVATQPALMNGDFENWDQKQISFPVGWDVNEESPLKSTDAYSGNYAIELQTYLHGDTAQPGYATTGISAPGGTYGGNPFTNQVDTAAFYYKFNPADPNDSAKITFSFKSGGSTFFTYTRYLPPASVYQYVEVPFSLGQAPDSVLVWLNSSKNWNLPASYSGAQFKVDEFRFKSQLPPVADFNLPDSVCQGAWFTLTDNSSNSPSSWSWTMPGASPSGMSGAQNPSIFFAGTGTFTITLVAGNAAGNSSPVNKTINVVASPIVTTSGATICFGDSATLTASGNAMNYYWSSGDSSASTTVSPSVNMNYIVTGNAANGCSDTAMASVIVLSLPNVGAVSSVGDTVCSGDSTMLNGTGAVTYLWTGGVTDGVYFMPSSTSTYTVTGTNAAGCSDTASITLVVDICAGIKQEEAPGTLEVFPNPFSSAATLTLEDKDASHILRIYDLQGRMVRVIVIPAGMSQFKIDREALERGNYFMVLSSGNKIIARQKVMIE